MSPSDGPGVDRDPRSAAPAAAPHGASRTRGTPRSRGTSRGRGLVPLVLTTVVTLVLGGASVARAVSAPPLDAHTDLEFSLDGTTWSGAPDPVLGSWGCDLDGGTEVPDPQGAIGGTPGADPCSMAPGESIDRTYHVRNSTDTGRSGLYEVGVGDYVVSDRAEFIVSSTIVGSGDDAGTVRLIGPGHPEAAQTVAPDSAVATLELAPGQEVRVVDRVSVAATLPQESARQSVSPRMWVSFSDLGVIDSDGDGLPDRDEVELGTDPSDPYNRMPDATPGRHYGPEAFLPTPPEGTVLDVDHTTLPPGLRLEDGAVVGIPTEAGTHDIAFTVTMPGGASYTSIRRVVVESSGTGSVDLPGGLWPILIIGIIGGGIGSLGAGAGAGVGSLGGAIGSSLEQLPPLDPGGFPPSGPAGSGSGSLPVPVEPGTDDDRSEPRPGTVGAESGDIPAAVITPPEGAPSDEWTRANSQVRGTLPVTGVEVADLLLWALTAVAAGTTLLLLASRRRRRRAGDD